MGGTAPSKPAKRSTCRRPTQSCFRFQRKMGQQQAAATIIMIQNPGLSSNRRREESVSKNSPAETGHKIIVYLARIPRPTANPASGQAHFQPRHIAWKPKTKAQHQQQVKGASMVISTEPAATTGMVKATATTPAPRLERP